MSKNIKNFLYASLAIASLGFAGFMFSAKSAADVTINPNSFGPQPASMISVSKPSLAPIVKKVLPSVVSIEVRGVMSVQESNPFADFQGQLPPEFRQFFNDFGGGIGGRESARQFRAAGSGVIIDAGGGYIVTNYHVVQNGKTIKVKTYDNHQYDAKLVGADPDTDLAVIKLVNYSGLQAIRFVNSSDAEVGDYVIAIGNPFDIGLTVTQGIVSALNRSTNLNYFDSYIQTDAAINSGNSGGALVDINGNLLGINTAIYSKTGGSVGIGYAIPSNVVKNVTDQLIKNGKVNRGQIGIRGNDVTSQLAQTLKLPVTQGAFITDVIQGSPADRAGLKAGDIILRMNDTNIQSFQQFRSEVAAVPAGTTVRLLILRDGKQFEVNVTSQQFRPTNASSVQQQAQPGAQVDVLGSRFEDSSKGVVVSATSQNSPFAQYGVQKGDVLVSVQNRRISSVQELNNALDVLQQAESVVFKFQRGSRYIYVTLTSNE